ncbi:MAG: hypothetical protein ACTHJZ_15775, partial [Trinickia sp.]|uniref:hypothetical protein n=1 Tax=Trinickia sp. TaxID=2571163 RepID=UPI003F7FD7C1
GGGQQFMLFFICWLLFVAFVPPRSGVCPPQKPGGPTPMRKRFAGCFMRVSFVLSKVYIVINGSRLSGK